PHTPTFLASISSAIAVARCFFFQAEDGIRDRNVTGVQTCALPIWVVLARIELLPVHVLEVVSEVTLDAVLRAFGHPSHLTDEITQLLCVFGQALGSD